MPNPLGKITLNIWIDPDLHLRLSSVAMNRDRPLMDELEVAIKKHLHEYEYERGKKDDRRSK